MDTSIAAAAAGGGTGSTRSVVVAPLLPADGCWRDVARETLLIRSNHRRISGPGNFFWHFFFSGLMMFSFSKKQRAPYVYTRRMYAKFGIIACGVCTNDIRLSRALNFKGLFCPTCSSLLLLLRCRGNSPRPPHPHHRPRCHCPPRSHRRHPRRSRRPLQSPGRKEEFTIENSFFTFPSIDDSDELRAVNFYIRLEFFW